MKYFDFEQTAQFLTAQYGTGLTDIEFFQRFTTESHKDPEDGLFGIHGGDPNLLDLKMPCYVDVRVSKEYLERSFVYSDNKLTDNTEAKELCWSAASGMSSIINSLNEGRWLVFPVHGWGNLIDSYARLQDEVKTEKEDRILSKVLSTLSGKNKWGFHAHMLDKRGTEDLADLAWLSMLLINDLYMFDENGRVYVYGCFHERMINVWGLPKCDFVVDEDLLARHNLSIVSV
jgi:hypothetical protein